MLMKTFLVSKKRRTCNNGRKGPYEKKKAFKPFSVFRNISCLYDTQLMVVKNDVLSLRLTSMKTFCDSQQK